MRCFEGIETKDIKETIEFTMKLAKMASMLRRIDERGVGLQMDTSRLLLALHAELDSRVD